MPSQPVGVTDTAPGANVAEADTVARSSPDIVTTTTADPGTGGASVAVTDRTFGGKIGTADANYYITVVGSSGIRETMLVTSGGGAGAGSLNVTRAQMGSTAVAHSIGAKVAKVTWVQRVEPVDATKEVSYRGRVATFDTLGRAGTTGQKIAAIHNATGSPVLVDVEKVTVDLAIAAAAGQAATVLPPKVRLWKFTAVPTNGTQLTKVPVDSTLASKTAVTVWGDASADATGSGVTLTVTLPAGGIASEIFGPRLILIGTTGSTTQVPPVYEGFDRHAFIEDETAVMTLRPLEGLCVFLDYVVATNNAVTNHWFVGIQWVEYTPA